MNKSIALENAQDFIETNIKQNIANFNLNEQVEACFSDKLLQADPNFEVLKYELNKIGFTAEPTNKPNWWIISKIK